MSTCFSQASPSVIKCHKKLSSRIYLWPLFCREHEGAGLGAGAVGLRTGKEGLRCERLGRRCGDDRIQHRHPLEGSHTHRV